MSEPTAADFSADLAALEHRQALLHAALAAYQAGFPEPKPLGAHGLALYHRIAVLNGQHSIEAVLVHAAGGEISSGFLPVGEPNLATIRYLQAGTAGLLLDVPLALSPDFLAQSSKPKQAQSPITWPNPCPAPDALPLQQDPPAAAADPEPEPMPAAEPEPTSSEAAPDEPPTPEDVAAIKDDLDRIFNRRPSKVKELTGEFRAFYEVPARTPVPKAITTRERVQWLRGRIDPILAEIAEFDQNVRAGVTESIAQGAA